MLFHVTANSDWSNLPLSGLFVEMLRRVVTLGPSQVDARTADKSDAALEAAPQSASGPAASSTALPPIQTLDGFGQLTPAAAPRRADRAGQARHDRPGPRPSARLLRPVGRGARLQPRHRQDGAQAARQGRRRSSAVSGYTLKKPRALEPWLYLAALALFAVDVLAMLVLSRGLRFRRRVAATSAVILLALTLAAAACHSRLRPSQAPHRSHGQRPLDDFALKASLQTHLAYVITGDPDIDRISEEGLSGLSKVLRARTALEPADPMGVDIDKDELAFFPIALLAGARGRRASLRRHARQGRCLHEAGRPHHLRHARPGALGSSIPARRTRRLTRLIGQLDIPPLEPVPENHVLTKSFYLMRSFPGRWDGGSLWVEAEPEDETERSERSRRTDGVSSIVITSNDFARAWALDDANRPLYPAVPGGEVQREMAFRAGVNIVMYALTGNYKADQVHVPALLERLGQ